VAAAQQQVSPVFARENLMRRRTFLSFVAVAVASRPLPAAVQQADKAARIGYLAMDMAGADPSPRNTFLQALRDLGYTEGRNLVIEYRDAEGSPSDSPLSRPN